jgi:hypothetical protein
MTHLQEEDLVEAYYDPEREALHKHLAVCAECRERFELLKQALDACAEYKIPERPPSYGADVWAQLAPRLPINKPRRTWIRWWMLGPVFAGLLIIAFLAGRFTREPETGASTKTRDRVLLMAISDHLERSQIVLTEISHAGPDDAETISRERDRARELVDENRLLRLSARRLGDTANAVLLDDLERVLLDIANAPANTPPAVSQETLRTIQDRLEDNSLLFKVRITAADTRKKGQRL